MSDLTMDEAAAWRAGAEAMREAAAREASKVAVRVECDWGAEHGIAVEIERTIRALPLPEPPASLQADGLCGRGA